MWRRALLAAAAVSYLICVLIMSGMQKEDLDVNMLGKLQRYNVNVDDINNEQIRQQCFSKNQGFTKDIHEDKTEHKYVSTTEYELITTTQTSLPSVTLNMDTIINYLKTRKDSLKNLDETTTVKTTSSHKEIVTRVVEDTENLPKIDIGLLRRYIQLETQETSFHKVDEKSETSKHDAIVNLKSDSKVANEITFIEKLIKNDLLKKQTFQTTTATTTTKYTVDIQNIYKQIDIVIANFTKDVSAVDKTIKKYPDKNEHSSSKYNVVGPVQIQPPGQKTHYYPEKRLFESFYNFLSEMNKFRNITSPPFFTDADNLYTTEKVQNNKMLGLSYQDTLGNYNKSSKNNFIFDKKPKQNALTTNLVKEIAESVKKDILKDLRNQLAGIYPKITQNTYFTKETTTVTTTVPTKRTIQEKDIAIIDKFMDLYEQIKSLKQTTFLLRANNESETYMNDVKQPNKASVKSTMFLPDTINRLQMPENKLPISSMNNYNTQPFLNYNLYIPTKVNKHHVPITIQTNSVEIQPLPVPISKPDSLVRQNIIVPSGYRLQGKNSNHLNHHIISKGNRYLDIPMQHMNKTNKYNDIKRYDGYNSPRYTLHNFQEPNRREEDIIRFRMRDNGNSRLDTDYYEKINFGNGYNRVNEERGIFNNRNIPRFHEKLERVDTGSDGTPVVSDIDMTGKHAQSADLPSRHQLSLVDMKKGSSYDDTHFKNFLKTQQKVTDMLERILATRVKTNTPRSVEAV